MLRIGLVIFSVLVLFGCSNAATDQEHYFSGQTMGTTYNVKYVTNDQLDHEQLKQSVEQRLIEINQLMSTYIDDSELSYLINLPPIARIYYHKKPLLSLQKLYASVH